ncbi:Nn.00g044470.m01.CDS01 [Neocucurbitaria sp. VM-36]
MSSDAPTLQEIIQLTRQKLTSAQEYDSIRECGRAALSLLPSVPELCLDLAYQSLHGVPYKEVKTCWRRLYTDASLWKVVRLAEETALPPAKEKNIGQEEDGAEAKWMDEVVKLLDMSLILTGAPGREEIVELWFSALKGNLPPLDYTEREVDLNGGERPAKRRKTFSSCQVLHIPPNFPTSLAECAPELQYAVPRMKELGLSGFQNRVSNIKMHVPLIIEGAILHWPALDERPWNSPRYLLEQTLSGRRLVPVEIGKSYTDEGWGQRIVTFKEFMNVHMLEERSEATKESGNYRTSALGQEQIPNGTATKRGGEKAQQVGYLAQHDLFAQVPSLRADISIPDYCYCDPAPSPHLTHIKPTPKLDEPLLNAWFGPAGTVSPLHTDPYHNILAQVVGYKYVRLYAPDETQKLYPRTVDENGVDMSNTSQVDLDEAMTIYPGISCWKMSGAEAAGDVKKGMDQKRRAFEKDFPSFRYAQYVEGILGPGDCLYLPVGWWHYVRSLTPSFSVSFWFN